MGLFRVIAGNLGTAVFYCPHVCRTMTHVLFISLPLFFVGSQRISHCCGGEMKTRRKALTYQHGVICLFAAAMGSLNAGTRSGSVTGGSSMKFISKQIRPPTSWHGQGVWRSQVAPSMYGMASPLQDQRSKSGNLAFQKGHSKYYTSLMHRWSGC